jgi:hypothetical protein
MSLSVPRYRLTDSQKIWQRRESSPESLDLWPEILANRQQRRLIIIIIAIIITCGFIIPPLRYIYIFMLPVMWRVKKINYCILIRNKGRVENCNATAYREVSSDAGNRNHWQVCPNSPVNWKMNCRCYSLYSWTLANSIGIAIIVFDSWSKGRRYDCRLRLRRIEQLHVYQLAKRCRHYSRYGKMGVWLCKIWGSHGGSHGCDYEELRLLGCYAVWLL